MPFHSKRQWRAAMGGHIPGISKEEAHEWAHETPSFKGLPDRAPAEKGKPTLRSKEALDFSEALRRRRDRQLQRQFLASLSTDEAAQWREQQEKSSSLPGKTVFVAKKLREQLTSSGTGKNVFDAVQGERDRSKRKKHASDEFVEFCTKIAFAVPRPGQTGMAAKHVGSFSGQATANFLKSPGSTTASVTNPRLSLRNAMTKTMRT